MNEQDIRSIQGHALRSASAKLHLNMTANDDMTFDDAFALLSSGKRPFPWQRALYDRLVAGSLPSACDLPTGLGKTSVIHLWLLALAANPRLPRRLCYVVNRRTVVDQATDEAERLRTALCTASPLRDALARLCTIAPRAGEAPLAISTLRGQRADNAQWRRDPSGPAIVIGTVDMIGSRLLFSGYGCGFRSRPLHAGLLGQDSLLIHDEAHLEPALQQLLNAIRREQLDCAEARALHVMAMSATGRERADFSLSDDDLSHELVQQRLMARKGIALHTVAQAKELPDRVAESALGLAGRVIVFLSSVEHVERCAAALSKAKARYATLTGTLRGHERDRLVRDPVFASFLPVPPGDVRLPDGSVYLIATSAGEVGIDLSADHMVSDIAPFDSMAQRLGRVNRYGEGDAMVELLCEPLSAPAEAADDDHADEDMDAQEGRKEAYLRARYTTWQLLAQLPRREDGRLDGSPSALSRLALDSRLNASTPVPGIRHVDALLFDRWSYTTLTAPLPGRPPVDEWLHGVAEWEPPRTTLAWRSEVSWLTAELLGPDSLDEFLADYPLRPRETLNDLTTRVLKHLQKIVARDTEASLRAWLVRHDAPATFWRLSELLVQHDPKRRPLLDGATVVLSPEAGGLKAGMLDGNTPHAVEADPPYDLGPNPGERLVRISDDDLNELPPGMRLVRALRREDEDDGTVWWRLYAVSRLADDEGSRTRDRPLLLNEHLQRTEAWALRIAQRLGLSDTQTRVLACAGRWHDLGKRRRLWQRSIRNFKEPALAKGPMQPADLGHYRHELGSLHDALAEAGFDKLSAEEQDLALHVIAAHHGRARPHFPAHERHDPEVRDDLVVSIAQEVPLRFDRLQRRYGRWGLAWLESLLRAADALGSEDEDATE